MKVVKIVRTRKTQENALKIERMEANTKKLTIIHESFSLNQFNKPLNDIYRVSFDKNIVKCHIITNRVSWINNLELK